MARITELTIGFQTRDDSILSIILVNEQREVPMTVRSSMVFNGSVINCSDNEETVAVVFVLSLLSTFEPATLLWD